MSFLNQFDIDQLKGKLSTDVSTLGKIYKAKKSPFQTRSVDHSLVEEYLKDGWEVEKELKTKTTLKKSKSHSKKFEDDIWCQFYELGYRHLNYDDRFHLPFTSNPEDKKQIDIIAIDNETVIIVECKSSDKPKKATSYRETFDALGPKIDGFRKVISQAFGKDLKVKYIFATRNLRMNSEDIDLLRLSRTGAFYFNDNTFDYINQLIKNYKGVARYQFFGMLFKNEIINLSKIEIPAVEGDMGGKKYYMFAIEPSLLLKMGFVLHRTKANETEFPTYQRLLVPTRLKGITKYIDDGGYFPNSLILNFNQKKHKVIFEPSSRSGDSRSRFGMLKIPNAYAIAYVIDGQHRLYGYANSSFKETNTIPVVAFNDLSTTEQLEIFMDINQNQKAVSPSLRLDLEEDLFWDSDRADSRIKALRSSIIKGLSNSPEGPLYKLISVGEDTYKLTFKPFSNALTHSGLLPFAKGNQYVAENSTSCLYNINNHNHDEEMKKSKKNIVDFLNACYELAEDNDFILSNRGTYAFVVLIGRLNTFLTETNKVSLNTSPKERFSEIEKYIAALLEYLKTMPAEEEAKFLKLYGSGAESGWLKPFISIVNTKFPEYNPKELIDWKERQDEQLQEEGRKYSIAIEKQMKKIVLEKIKTLFGENWDLEINSIKRECIKRAEEENEKHYKEGLNKKTATIWTEMFNINDYKSIIDKYWAKTPDGSEKNGFTTYSDDFSIDIGQGFNSKSDRIRWISFFNSYRNQLAHEGTKEKGLNKEEVEFLKKIYDHFEN